MRQAELDGTSIGTAGKSTCNSAGENSQLIGTFMDIGFETGHNNNKQKSTAQEIQECSEKEIASTTTSSSTPGEEPTEKIRRKPTRVSKPSFYTLYVIIPPYKY